MIKESFDDIIKKYARELEAMGKLYGGEIEAETEQVQKEENETVSEKEIAVFREESTADMTKSMQQAEQNSENTDEGADINTDPVVSEPSSEPRSEETTSFAVFSAAVFSGEGAYPVEGARIVVYRDDNIYAFLQSDENGKTKKVQLPAFSKESTLTPDNPESNIDYFADVFAEGFIAQKGLLVSSVGGSEILLRVLMIPEEERIG